jgi:hypothetical protein
MSNAFINRYNWCIVRSEYSLLLLPSLATELTLLVYYSNVSIYSAESQKSLIARKSRNRVAYISTLAQVCHSSQMLAESINQVCQLT